MLEVVEQLGSVLARYDLRMGHLLQLLEEGPSMFDGVEEEDEGLGWRHCSRREEE